MCAGSIQAAWRQGDHVQRNKLLDELIIELQSVSEDTAQGLSKDPEVRGMYDKLCSMMMVCCR